MKERRVNVELYRNEINHFVLISIHLSLINSKKYENEKGETKLC